MLYELDRSVGRVVEALRKRAMLADSVIVFSTDNGGPAGGFNLNAASNWPLRGVKNTLWEGSSITTILVLIVNSKINTNNYINININININTILLILIFIIMFLSSTVKSVVFVK